MQKHFFLKYGKVFTNVACSPLILISNSSRLAAQYLPNEVEQSITTFEISNINIDFPNKLKKAESSQISKKQSKLFN